MFETSVVALRQHARHRFILLSGSAVMHGAIVAAIVSAGLRSVQFPERTPLQLTLFRPVATVALPPAAAPPRAEAATPAARPLPHPALTAPQVVPDVEPEVPAATASDATAAAEQTGNSGAEHGGSGIDGVVGGVGDSTGTDLVSGPPDGIYHVGKNVTAPVVLHRVEPVYPQLAIRSHLQGVVEVECIIDKSGRIRDVRVVHSTFGVFDASAVDAVRQWIFAPGRLDGSPVDTIFDLTVRFAMR